MIELPIAFAISFVALLIAVAVAASPRWPGASRPRGLFLAFLVLLAVMGVLIGVRDGYKIVAAARWQPVVAMLLSPTLYLGIRALTEDPPQALHVLALRHGWPPALVAVLSLLPTGAPIPIDLFVFASMGYYLVRLIGLFRSGPDRFIHVSGAGYPLTMLGLGAGIGLFGFVLAVDVTIFVLRGLEMVASDRGLVLAGSAVVAVGLLAFVALGIHRLVRWPGPDKHPRGGVGRDSGQGAGATDRDREVLEALDRIMRERQLFRDSDLTLARAARRINRPARDVSRAVNRARGENFSSYVNGLRIDYAKALLAGSDASVTEVMLESGFVTKSNFNLAFSRATGMPPTRYREIAADGSTAGATGSRVSG